MYRYFMLTAFAVLLLSGCAGRRPPVPPEPEGPGTVPVERPRGVSAGERISADLPLDTTSVYPVLETIEGEATYYASRFDGRRTASGIVFRNSEPWAAHRRYPFGTVVRVTNLRNDRSVILRIVDRGPFGNSRRIIDVSQAAARELDFITAGHVPVRVEVLEWGDGR